MKKKRFLIVSPHPDDAELGIGCTIIKLAQKGHTILLVDMTSGEPTPYGTEEKRRKETKEASKVIKIHKRVNLGLPNRYLFDTKEARLLLAGQMRLFKPDFILCPYGEDAHPDHAAAAKIAEGARFYAKYTKAALKGGPHYPGYLFYYFCSHARITPPYTFLVDISAQFKEKMRAMKCYRSQFIINRKNSFIFDYVGNMNRCLGQLVRCEYAEPLYSREAVKLGDIACLL